MQSTSELVKNIKGSEDWFKMVVFRFFRFSCRQPDCIWKYLKLL